MDNCAICSIEFDDNQHMGYSMDECCLQIVCYKCLKSEQFDGIIDQCLCCDQKIHFEIPNQQKQILCKQHEQQICFKQNERFLCEVCIFETNDHDNLIQIDQEDIYEDLKMIKAFFKMLVLENNHDTVEELIEKQVVYFFEIQKFIDKINNRYTIDGLKLFRIQQKKKKNNVESINSQKINVHEFKQKEEQIVQINQVYNFQKNKVVNKQKTKINQFQQNQQEQVNKQQQDYIKELENCIDQLNMQNEQQQIEIESLKNQLSQKANIQKNNLQLESQQEKIKQDKIQIDQMKLQNNQQKELLDVQQEKIDQQKKQIEFLKQSNVNLNENFQKLQNERKDMNSIQTKLNNYVIQLKKEKENLEEQLKKVKQLYLKQNNNVSLPQISNKIRNIFKKSESQKKLNSSRLELPKPQIEKPQIEKAQNEQSKLDVSMTSVQSILKNKSGNTTQRQKPQELNMFQKLFLKMKGVSVDRPKSRVNFQEPYMNKVQNQGFQLFGSKWLIERSQIEQLKIWLNKKDLQLKLIYKASVDGFTSQSFYQKCENKKQTILVIKSQNNEVFGGYADIAWKKTNTLWNEGQGKSFVFSFTKNSKHPCKDKKYELSGNQYYFVKFGYDIAISDQCDQNSKSYCNIGCKYQIPLGMKPNTDQTKQYLAGSYLFQVKEIENYQIQ